jgi:hypothetical protein
MNNYKFTFKTDAEYFKARMTGFIPEYDCVRMTVKRLSGGTIDFPIHSEEELHDTVKRMEHEIIDIYPSKSFYEWDEY